MIIYFKRLIVYNLFLALPVMLVDALMDKQVVERMHLISKSMVPKGSVQSGTISEFGSLRRTSVSSPRPPQGLPAAGMKTKYIDGNQSGPRPKIPSVVSRPLTPTNLTTTSDPATTLNAAATPNLTTTPNPATTSNLTTAPFGNITTPADDKLELENGSTHDAQPTASKY